VLTPFTVGAPDPAFHDLLRAALILESSKALETQKVSTPRQRISAT
jgi:hypothetical protein